LTLLELLRATWQQNPLIIGDHLRLSEVPLLPPAF
jgi:hypothetical protein